MRQRQRHEIRDDLIKACIRFETSYQSDTYNAHYDDELAYCDDMIDEFSTELANVLTEQYSEETTQGGSVPTCDLDNPKLGDIKIIVRSTSDTEWIAEVMRFGGHIWGSVCVRSGPTRDSAIAAADDRINKLRSDEAAEAVKQQRLLDSLEVLAR
jgi:hypothetical protein